MTIAATMLFGRIDPLGLFDAIAADLVARGVLPRDRVAAARAAVPSGRLPATALLDVGAPPEMVLRALATVAGVPPAPPRPQWNVDVRAQLRVDASVWLRLTAVPIGMMERRPLIAFADVVAVTSSAALALPDHVACVALEADVRDALAVAAQAPRPGVSFLAPPNAVAQAMPATGSAAFAPSTAPALAGTMAGPGPVTPFGQAVGWPQPAQPMAAQPQALGFGQAPTLEQMQQQQLLQMQQQMQLLQQQMLMQQQMQLQQPGAAVPSFVPPSSQPTPYPPPPVASATPYPPPVVSQPNLPSPTPPVSASGTQLFHGGAGTLTPQAPSQPLQSFSAGPMSFASTPQSPVALPTGQSPFNPTPVPPEHAAAVAPPASFTQPLVSSSSPLTGPVVIGPGLQCGRFLLEKKLGEGGMATVFVGNPVDGQGPAAAVKVVHEHLLRSSQGEELRRRFQREVGAMRQLHHENIVECLDAGRVGDTEFLATELITGGSLSALLQRCVKLPPLVALSWFGDLLEGLAHAHDKGVVHRDLKPDNLLIAADGTLKIADFGIARVAEGTQLTATGGIIGTPSYMSPEQARANPIDARTDLYTSAVILYEVLTGRNPFDGDTVMATLGNVLLARVRPLGEVEPATPFLVDLVVGRLMSPRPDDRYPSARAALEALRPVLDRARAHRDGWVKLVAKQQGALAAEFTREATEHAAFARAEQKLGEPHRLVSALAAFRATSLVSDHREGNAVQRALETSYGSARFARSSSAALASREQAAESLAGDDKRRACMEVAQLYLDESNPLFAASFARRAAGTASAGEAELAFLARLLPAVEVDEVRGLAERVGAALPASSAGTAPGRAWKPAAATPLTSIASATTSPEARPGLPGYLKAAIVIAATAVPIGVAILALRGCG